MPNMDGIEFIKKVKQDVNTKEIPIIMVSTRSHKDDIIKAIINKVDDYITKPFTPQTVHDKINNLLEKRKLKETGNI
jgi:DNA-binding response OmpR family regulator